MMAERTLRWLAYLTFISAVTGAGEICESSSHWRTITTAETIKEERVSLVPGQWFQVTACTREAGPCALVPRYNATCATRNGFAMAMVRRFESDEGTFEYIKVPVGCRCVQ